MGINCVGVFAVEICMLIIFVRKQKSKTLIQISDKSIGVSHTEVTK